jgi:hypothetical protein
MGAVFRRILFTALISRCFPKAAQAGGYIRKTCGILTKMPLLRHVDVIA